MKDILRLTEIVLYPFYIIPVFLGMAIMASLSGKKLDGDSLAELFNPVDGSLGL